MGSKSLKDLRLIWIYDGSLTQAMDRVTWLRIVEELRKAGWLVTLVAAGPDGFQQIQGVEVFCIQRSDIYFLRQVVFHFKVFKYILMHLSSTDLIIFHEISAPWILPIRFLRQLIGVHLPLLVMDTRSLPMPSRENERWKDRIRKRFYKIVVNLGNRYADGRLAITQRMAVEVKIPLKKLWGIWPSGADIEYFSAGRSIKKWPSKNEHIHLLYHGSLHHERNLMSLCKAVMLANGEGAAFILSLVGDGSERPSLEEYALGSNNAIRVSGQIPYEQISDLLSQVHIGVLPFPDEQKFRVSSPIKLFEYMAAGLPILATRIACHQDVVASGNFVFWAEHSNEQGLLNALRLAWKSHDLLNEMGRQALIAAEQWTWEVSGEKLIKALEAGFERSTSGSEHDLIVNKINP